MIYQPSLKIRKKSAIKIVRKTSALSNSSKYWAVRSIDSSTPQVYLSRGSSRLLKALPFGLKPGRFVINATLKKKKSSKKFSIVLVKLVWRVMNSLRYLRSNKRYRTRLFFKKLSSLFSEFHSNPQLDPYLRLSKVLGVRKIQAEGNYELKRSEFCSLPISRSLSRDIRNLHLGTTQSRVHVYSYLRNLRQYKRVSSVKLGMDTPLNYPQPINSNFTQPWTFAAYVSFLSAELHDFPSIRLAIQWPESGHPNLPLPAVPVAEVSSWLGRWSDLPVLYAYLTCFPRIQLYLRSSKKKKKNIIHHVYFKFVKSRLILSLLSEQRRHTHFFVSVGIFMKHFKRKKSLRKGRAFKILMMRFLRKLLLTLKLPSLELVVRGAPFYLTLLLNSLFKPIPHPVPDLLTGGSINEVSNKKRNLSIESIQFERFKAFGYMKPKKRGRVKRKIRRRLYRFNQIDD